MKPFISRPAGQNLNTESLSLVMNCISVWILQHIIPVFLHIVAWQGHSRTALAPGRDETRASDPLVRRLSTYILTDYQKFEKYGPL